MLKKRNMIVGALMGVMMTGIIGTGTSFAATAQWVCPNGYADCPGPEYCAAHDQCVANGYCVHDTCVDGHHNEYCTNYVAPRVTTSVTTPTYSNSYYRGSHHRGGHGHCGR